MKEKQRKSRGITLVALVVTIVVLLILAGITITMLFSENGIIKKAQEASDKTSKDKFNTEEGLNKLTNSMNDALNQNSGIKALDILNAADKSEYYGKVVDYEVENSTLKENLNNEEVKWLIFYADNKNIYLISSKYIPYSCMPKSSKGNSLTKSTLESYPEYAACFTGILDDYEGSEDIKNPDLQALNSSYYKYLTENSKISKNKNMKAVAYMMDTKAWGIYNGKGAKYSIGGPTIELFAKSYSQKYNVDYRAEASSIEGYKISKDGGENYVDFISYYPTSSLNKSDALYFAKSPYNYDYYWWIASPANCGSDRLMQVDAIFESWGGGDGIYSNERFGFRPIICLNDNTRLELQKDGTFLIK